MRKVETICIVDDDSLYTLLLRKKIEKLNLCNNIVAHPDGEAAIEAIKNLLASGSSLPDVILLDINMPIMNGWEFMEAFAKLLPQIRKNVAIYIASSSIAQEDRQRAQANAYIRNYITKPLETDTLLRITELN